MPQFATTREAKQFLIDTIVDQAKRDQTPLSRLEEQMLYFTETDWCPFDTTELNAAFERDYDSGIYEVKIAEIIRNFKARAKKSDTSQLESWKSAVRALKQEDHYLIVLIRVAEGSLRPDGQQSQSSLSTPFIRKTIFIGLISFVVIFAVLELIKAFMN